MSSRKRPLSPQAFAPSRESSNDSVYSGVYCEADVEPISRQASLEQTCLSDEDVKGILSQKEQTVMSILNIKRNTARLLLSRTRPPWDTDKLVQAWFDDGMCARLLGKQCRVRDDESVICLCCGPCTIDEVIFPLSCDHVACTDCLANFLHSKLKPGDGSLPLRPPYTCKQLGGCDDGVLEVDAEDLPLNEADQVLLSSSEVSSESEAMPFRKCTCGKLNRPTTGQINLFCECGRDYCFSCGRETFVRHSTPRFQVGVCRLL